MAYYNEKCKSLSHIRCTQNHLLKHMLFRPKRKSTASHFYLVRLRIVIYDWSTTVVKSNVIGPDVTQYYTANCAQNNIPEVNCFAFRSKFNPCVIGWKNVNAVYGG